MKIKKKSKKAVGILLLLSSVACMFYPVIYWISNDYLTYMQVFKEFWYLYTIGIFLALMWQLFFDEV